METTAYSDFASVYDMFMDNIPYEEWCEHLCRVLNRYGISDGLVLDLGCGTGTLTSMLASKGYDMIGVDNASEMLAVAMDKRDEEGLDILYLLQDMREFELYGTVRAIVSICDSINYITSPDELKTVFKLVNNYLDPGGIFVFDCNTEFKYRELLGDQTIAEDREEGSFIWDNYYDEEEMINEYRLSLFIPEESGLYSKHTEYHYQRCYLPEELRSMIEEAGMELLGIYDAFTDDEPHKESERLLFVVRTKK
ncbi:MAG: class I SAM-dependent methyltransferase [Lachnospiraceae bacterium]|nr:class I SAM-dependent methyltransferase [Lachnospiraceae bacterium]